MRRAVLLSLLLAATAASAAVPAHAARFARCNDLAGATCATVRVPLDRSGHLRGTIGLHVVRLPARRPSARALIYLSGGPGGAGVPEFAAAMADGPLRALRARYDLVGFDQRGTGRSDLLRCPAIERDRHLRSTRASARCAARLGPRRALYTTAATLEDLEAVRRAVGADRLLLYGVSYGTEVALAYARAHPEHTERLLLDSVVDPDEADPWALESLRAIGPSLRALCPARCRDVSRDPEADIAALTANLEAHPLPGVAPRRLSDLLFDADYLPELRSGIPAAVVAVLRYRNPAPLRRLLTAAGPLENLGTPRQFSAARYNTGCEEARLPWPRGAPFDERLTDARRAADALGPDAFRPFDFDVVRGDEINLCLRWPEAARAPVLPNAGGPYPDVPVLLLQGGEDLRTPPAISARIAAAFPRAQRVVVPGVGHAVLAGDPSRCGLRRVVTWLRGGNATGRCPRVQTGVRAVPVVPRTLAQLPPARGFPPALGRTLAGIALTLRDLDFALSGAFSLRAVKRGLAGGRYSTPGRDLVLHRFAAVRGLWLDGSSHRPGDIALVVGGSQALHGRITVRRGRLEGRLGGRAVHARLR